MPTLRGVRLWAAAPGVMLTVVLALAAAIAAHEIKLLVLAGRSSPLSPVFLAIAFGIMWRHFVGLGARTEQGVQWVLGTMLRAGIALVGLRLSLEGLTSVGPRAVAIVAVCITAALVVSRLVGYLLGLSPVMQKLLAVGSAVCGCTAIIAASPAIRAKPAETGAALTCVVLTGTLGMLLYPWLAAFVFDGQSRPSGVFLGSAIPDTSQVIGASLIYAQEFDAPEAVAFASATKLFRNLSIAVLIPILACSARTQDGSCTVGQASRQSIVPGFVLWFVAFALLRTVGDQFATNNLGLQPIWLQALGSAQVLSDSFLVCGMTAVGLSVSLAQMRELGLRAIGAALLIGAATGLCSLGLTYSLFKE